MRSLVLVGAAILALTSITSVQAGTVWKAKKTVEDCVHLGLYKGAAQVNCSTNVVGDPGYHNSNDNNTQKIYQDNDARVKKAPRGTLQLNAGANVVVKGDDNTQKIKQTNDYNNRNYDSAHGLEQVNIGLNVVENGNNNYQKIDQSNTMNIGGHSYQPAMVE